MSATSRKKGKQKGKCRTCSLSAMCLPTGPETFILKLWKCKGCGHMFYRKRHTHMAHRSIMVSMPAKGDANCVKVARRGWCRDCRRPRSGYYEQYVKETTEEMREL